MCVVRATEAQIGFGLFKAWLVINTLTVPRKTGGENIGRQAGKQAAALQLQKQQKRSPKKKRTKALCASIE